MLPTDADRRRAGDRSPPPLQRILHSPRADNFPRRRSQRQAEAEAQLRQDIRNMSDRQEAALREQIVDLRKENNDLALRLSAYSPFLLRRCCYTLWRWARLLSTALNAWPLHVAEKWKTKEENGNAFARCMQA